MRLREALYFAFIIGHRGILRRLAWERNEETKHDKLASTCSRDENDMSDYIGVYKDGYTTSTKKITPQWMDEVQISLKYQCPNYLRDSTYDFGICDITQEDAKADDWIVDHLFYTGKRF